MHRGILTLPMLGLQLRCACSPAPPGFLEMCIEKLLLFLISLNFLPAQLLLALPAQHSCYHLTLHVVLMGFPSCSSSTATTFC